MTVNLTQTNPGHSSRKKLAAFSLAAAILVLAGMWYAGRRGIIALDFGGRNKGGAKVSVENKVSGPGAGYLEGLAASPVRNKRDHEINWMDWGEEAFERAKQEGKLLLLDLTAPWCHWCHVMDETTYSTPEVIDFINKHFVAIRVDADRHPEVEKAYISGGWPTTAILLQSGETLASLTYVPPDRMMDWMQQVLEAYEEQKDDIAGKVAAQRAGFLAQAETAAASGNLPDAHAVSLRLTGAILDSFDEQYGGFGAEENGFKPKFPQPAVAETLMAILSDREDKIIRDTLSLTLEKQRGIIDPVWGGFFRYSVDRQWKTPHYEKMLGDQANLLLNYLHYWQLTDDAWAKDVCLDIVRYVENWLSGPEWELWASQDADLGSHDASALFMPGEEYFPKGDAERRKLGIPHIDKDVLATWSAKMAAALIEYGAATENWDYVIKGERTLSGIADKMKSADGWIRHSLKRDDQEKPTLSDQTAYGIAALKAHAFTGKLEWLDSAIEMGNTVISLFEDTQSGGYYFQPFDPKAKGNLLFLGKPFEENCEAARFLSDLARVTGDSKYAESAKRALEFASAGYAKYGHMAAPFYLALRSLEEIDPKLVVVLADGKQPDEKELVELARFGTRGTVVRFLNTDSGKSEIKLGDLVFPAADESKVYLCVGTTCFSPVSLGEKGLAGKLNKLADRKR
ncbi:MAG: thioredoxin domain-containing protein [bacterium]